MRVVVLGSGVIGVTSAYYLALAGHEVTVIDREAGPALETSFANAGQISPGYAAPWAAPGVPLKAVKWMFQKHAPLAIRPDDADKQFQLQWMWQMLQNCTAERYAINKNRMVRLAEYSRDCLKALRASTGIQYEGRTGGTLQVFRTQQQLDGAAKDIAVLKEANVPYNCSRGRNSLASSRLLPPRRTSWRADCACPATRPATASCSPHGSPPWRKNRGSRSVMTPRSMVLMWKAAG